MFTKPVNTKLGIIIYVSLKLSDTKKYQRWLVRFSHACCENLGISIFLKNFFFSILFRSERIFVLMWYVTENNFVFCFPFSLFVCISGRIQHNEREPCSGRKVSSTPSLRSNQTPGAFSNRPIWPADQHSWCKKADGSSQTWPVTGSCNCR